MAQEKPKKRKKTGGRKKGSLNKATHSAKEAFEYAFGKLGGAEGLATWADKNRDEFYKLYSRLIPRPLDLGTGEGEGDSGLRITIQRFSEAKS